MKRIIQQKLQCLKQLCQPKISKHLSESGGRLNLLNSITFFILFLYNTTKYIFLGESIVDRWAYTFLFLALSIVSYFIITRKALIVIDLFLGFMMIIASPYYSDTAGLVFFFFAYKQILTKKYKWVVLIPLIIALSLRLMILKEDPISTFTMIFIFGYISIKYILLYHSDDKKDKDPVLNIHIIDISEEEKAILKLYCNGMSYNNISRFLGINNSNDTIRRKITKIKRDYNKKTDAEFVKWLFDSV